MHFTGTPATTNSMLAAGVRLMRLKLDIDIESRDPTNMSETKGSNRTTKTTKRKAPTQADNHATSCK